MEAAKSSDLLFWAACYSLHVQWTPDGSHAWDIAAEALGSKVRIRISGSVTSSYSRLSGWDICWPYQASSAVGARAACTLWSSDCPCWAAALSLAGVHV